MNKTSQPEQRSNGIAGDQLRAFVERIENLELEIGTLKNDKADVYAEAKGVGFDVKIMRKVVALRKKAADARREEAEILDVYLTALGMQGELAV